MNPNPRKIPTAFSFQPLAFAQPPCRQCTDRAKRQGSAFFNRLGPVAREKMTMRKHLRDVLTNPAISHHGMEINQTLRTKKPLVVAAGEVFSVMIQRWVYG